jgi:DNA-binding transcriptional MerR regulator
LNLSPHPATAEEELVDKSPDAFRTISEVADDLDVPQHVLRFWETRFSQIKPLKRGGGRRYYRPDDVALIQGLKALLYGQGYTIKGVQRILKEQGVRHVQAIGRGQIVPGPEPTGLPGRMPESSLPADATRPTSGHPPQSSAAASQGAFAAAPVTTSFAPRDLHTVLRALHEDLAEAHAALRRALDGPARDSGF